ncbi:hypothetical protein H1C71_012848 [Ictidomys tridecemlineatus]|nr:hypothetical protein H1C71_012848 [Ictidomys tridecemlineatus]
MYHFWAGVLRSRCAYSNVLCFSPGFYSSTLGLQDTVEPRDLRSLDPCQPRTSPVNYDIAGRKPGLSQSPEILSLLYSFLEGQKTFFVNNRIINILAFVGHVEILPPLLPLPSFYNHKKYKNYS